MGVVDAGRDRPSSEINHPQSSRVQAENFLITSDRCDLTVDHGDGRRTTRAVRAGDDSSVCQDQISVSIWAH